MHLEILSVFIINGIEQKQVVYEEEHSLGEIMIFSETFRREGVPIDGKLDTAQPRYEMIREGYEENKVSNVVYRIVFDLTKRVGG